MDKKEFRNFFNTYLSGIKNEADKKSMILAYIKKFLNQEIEDSQFSFKNYFKKTILDNSRRSGHSGYVDIYSKDYLFFDENGKIKKTSSFSDTKIPLSKYHFNCILKNDETLEYQIEKTAIDFIKRENELINSFCKYYNRDGQLKPKQNDVVLGEMLIKKYLDIEVYDVVDGTIGVFIGNMINFLVDKEEFEKHVEWKKQKTIFDMIDI